MLTQRSARPWEGPLAPQGVWGLLSFPADCHPICSQCSDAFLPRSPSLFPEHWLPDKHILAAPELCSSKPPTPKDLSQVPPAPLRRQGKGPASALARRLSPLLRGESHPSKQLRLCKCQSCRDGASPSAVGDTEALSLGQCWWVITQPQPSHTAVLF